MKTRFFILILLFLGIGYSLSAQKAKKKNVIATPQSRIISVKAKASASAPYTIQVIDAGAQFAPRLQSFAFASSGSVWLMVGGRTNGFHGTSDPESTFPSSLSNKYFWVVDPVARKSWSLAIPSAFMNQLSSTNIEFYQDGNILYCIGGYGSDCPQDSTSCYQTFPALTAIDVPAAMTAIKNQNANALAASIASINDERMRVTGGTLRKLGDWFYLILGHNYFTKYKGGITGIYTEQVRKFQIAYTGSSLAIQNYQAYNVPWTAPGLTDQFHRRDLNVVESVMTDGTIGLTVYGGVFTKASSAYMNPIYIFQDGSGNTSFAIDTVYKQMFNLYDCGNVAMYDRTTGNMYASMIGGITFYYYDKNGELQPSNLLNFMPFSNNITTITRYPDGSSFEVPQQTPALPGYIGANSEFIPAQGINIYPGTSDVIDYASLPGDGQVLIGYLYGGIICTASQSSEFNPTYANNKIYEIHLVRGSK